MNCPKCAGAALAPEKLNFLLEIDRCPSCSGMWFDQQEIYGKVKSPQLFFEAFKKAYQGSTKTDLPCPRDSTPMIRAAISEANLPFEACEKCGGMWFDQGEVRALNAYLESWNERQA